VLATAWNLATPPFEAPDEDAHVRYVLFLTQEGRLPDPRVEGERAGNQSFHPPLYYGVLAGALRASGISYPAAVAAQRIEPWTWDTLPRNYFHPSPAPAGYLHFLRTLSTVFGIVTVLCTYLAATMIGTTAAVRASATATTAALPQFTYLSAAVNPTSLATALSAIGLVLLLRLMRGPERPRTTAAVFGAIAGLAVLSEYHAVYLLALALLGYLFVAKRDLREFIRDAVPAGAAFVAVAGWFFALNAIRYGDASGLSMQRLLAPELLTPRSILSPYFIWFFPSILFESFLGVFGWLNAYLPESLYVGYGLLWVVALWGIGQAVLVRRSWSAERRIFVLAPLLILVLVVYANLTFSQPQGRYFFPALVAISLLLTLGLSELRGRVGRVLLLVAPAYVIAANLYSLVLVASSFVRA